MSKLPEISELFDLSATIAAELLQGKRYPWEVLDDISAFICALGRKLPETEFSHPSELIWIAKDAVVAPSAFIGGPCIIDHGAEVRHCAFIRENALIGKHAVVGNSVEIKNAILSDYVETPHFNYVGDSVLGRGAHMGAGSVTSNIKSDKTDVVIRCGGTEFVTGRQKIGAFLGDEAEIGCNSVLNPGTVVGRSARVYPLSSVRGTVPERYIWKSSAEIVPQI